MIQNGHIAVSSTAFTLVLRTSSVTQPRSCKESLTIRRELHCPANQPKHQPGPSNKLLGFEGKRKSDCTLT